MAKLFIILKKIQDLLTTFQIDLPLFMWMIYYKMFMIQTRFMTWIRHVLRKKTGRFLGEWQHLSSNKACLMYKPYSLMTIFTNDVPYWTKRANITSRLQLMLHWVTFVILENQMNDFKVIYRNGAIDFSRGKASVNK